MVLPAVIAAGAALGSAYMSQQAQEQAIRDAKKAQDEALERRLKSVSDLEDASGQYGLNTSNGTQFLNPNDYMYEALAGYRPENESIVTLGDSAMEGISLDPATRAAQMQALTELSQMTTGDGMSAIDAANVAKINQGIGQAQRGSRDAIASNMRQRGISGSGLEMAAQLQNQQASADRASMAGQEEAANALQRKMAALGQLGSLGGQMRGQDFNQAATVADAQDAVSRFNAQNSQNVMSRNTGARNSASEADWRNRQGVSNNNTSTRLGIAEGNNSIAAGQAGFRNGVQNQQYDRRYDQEALRSGIASDGGNNAENAAMRSGQTQSNMYTGLGQAAMQGASSYMSYDAAEKDRIAKYGK
jgi:hypothetical protein